MNWKFIYPKSNKSNVSQNHMFLGSLINLIHNMLLDDIVKYYTLKVKTCNLFDDLDKRHGRINVSYYVSI
jgi:hypothetical protein